MEEQQRRLFPWHQFQLWLREGFVAGAILNKVVIASWAEEDRDSKQVCKLTNEEHELLWGAASSPGQPEILYWLAKLPEGQNYPALEDQDARALWVALSEYGTKNKQFQGLHSQLKKFVSSFSNFDNFDSLIHTSMDVLWRSIGPATDPIRANVDKAANAEKAA
jgi:hypothetical protein